MNFKQFSAEIAKMVIYADTPTCPNRDQEFRRIFGVIHGAELVGGISKRQYFQLFRDVSDCHLLWDDLDRKEAAKQAQERMAFGE